METHTTDTDLDALFLQHGAASLDKQIYLEAMLGKAGWSFSLDEGVLAFRLPHDVLQLQAQLLGTESQEHGTWLWAWANADSGIPKPLLKQAEFLKAFGTKENIAALATPELKLSSQINGGKLAAVAVGICRAGCAFRVAYPGGVLHMLIKDAKYKRSVLHPLKRIAAVFPLFVQRNHVSNHHAAFIHYVNFYRLKAEENGNTVTAIQGFRPRAAALPVADMGMGASSLPVLLEPHTNPKLFAEFDALNKLKTIRAEY